jgi:FlaA1/EpsC-like NDP-sugar epimerase/lipopolysaccharide/colanic/teichoic acid biosynthesis glycosyltransferase/ActR/RegA family two-component response regulator
MVKRFIDLVFSLVALILLAPVFFLVAIAIKLNSSGPVFYAQERVGRRGRTFRILKFRSMIADAEQVGPQLTGRNDSRVTRVGRWLRRLKLDEFPQLMNVLTGDMSLVGPRPEIPSMVEQYTSAQRAILEVKPGITGPTQLAWIDESDAFPIGVNTLEHYTQQFMQEKLKSDLEYIRTHSLVRDLGYVILTPVAIGRRILGIANPPLTGQIYARLALDGLAIATAHLWAFMLRFDWALPEKEVRHLLYGLPIVCATYLLSFLVLRTHRSIWRFSGVEDLWQIIKASALGLGLHGFALILLGLYGYPRSVLILTAPLAVLLTGGTRFLVRLRAERQAAASPSRNGHRNVIIIGAGETGEMIAREILSNPSLGYGLIGFVDDDPQKQGATIHNRPVLGAIDRLPEIVQAYAIREAIIAISTATGKELRRIGSICATVSLEFKILPSFTQLVQGDGKLRYLRKVNVDELLGREPVVINREVVIEYFRGKRVMVTGAGGSIGAELCRQLVGCGVESLIMVERAENALYDISLEIRQRFPEADVTAALADIKHIPRMSEIFERTRPQVVFHAAAYKHVPILEDHPGEAVLNNIIGTKRLAEVAQKFDVNTFVFISTDKAVRPKSLMGATKKISEKYIMAFNQVLRQSSTPGRRPRFFVVRFGNVLGSAGSVVPLFQKQIEDGEPITITDPQVTRFFMTISEAVGLVLQSSTMDCEEDIFILNMGEPIKIDDLVDDLALTSGLNPSQVTKRYIGLRPGEKLHESLWDDEEVLASQYGRIFAVRQPQVSFENMEERLSRLETLAMVGDVSALLRQIHDIIPSYAPSLRESVFSIPEVGEKYRVLVIDDDETICDLLKEAVNGTYEMATARSAREGFDQIQRGRPHLILLDVNLPDQNGLQVCQTLRGHPQYRNIPIIMMTGYGDKDAVVTGLNAGADDYLAKPFRLEELRARIEAVLRRAGSEVRFA